MVRHDKKEGIRGKPLHEAPDKIIHQTIAVNDRASEPLGDLGPVEPGLRVQIFPEDVLEPVGQDENPHEEIPGPVLHKVEEKFFPLGKTFPYQVQVCQGILITLSVVLGQVDIR